MSSKDLPKQLLPLIRSRTDAKPQALLTLATERLRGLIPQERCFICTGKAHCAAVLSTVPGLSEAQLLPEPMGRDTLNAVGFAAAVFQKLDPDAIFAVLTADHIIEPTSTFQQCLDLGYRLVEADPNRLITFAITPTHPATGYGYVERAGPITDVEGCVIDGKQVVHRVARFVEKPDLHKAQAYVESGMFGWNSGMFVFHAGTVLDLIKRFQPDAHAGLIRIQEAWGTNDQQTTLLEVYPNLPKISVDYGVMEPASELADVQICMVDMDVQWLDIGSWPSFANTLAPDDQGNRTAGVGDHRVLDVTDSVIVNEEPDHMIAMIGCTDMIVVHTPEATLIMPSEQAERVKNIHEMLPEGLK